MRSLRYCLIWLAALLLAPTLANADENWQSISQQAHGQTVWFNAWGGDPAVNRYLDWVSAEVKRDYAVDLRIVHIADAADAVKRIQTEARAGRSRGGSIDLLWINGENFRTLKQANLLRSDWAEKLPNWRYVDTRKPVREDFSLATDGAESPWGSAQLTFIARRSQLAQPPDSAQALLAFATAHPGSVTYPRPPDFTGTAFLEQLLVALTDRPEALRQPPQETSFAAVTAPLWDYLDRLHPLLWRQGRDFPLSPARMDAMMAQGTLQLSLTFNPLHAQQKAASGELPQDSYSFGFKQGMLGNVHFVAIPANARAMAGAQVVANFLLSPQAQLRKADPQIWGDPSVLDSEKLNDAQRAAFYAVQPKATPPMLAEPHAAWVDALEQEWLRRYGTH
ncbi:TPA: ABC transporter substrate-binding protein [Klebsiella aerogenes]|nr:ABC transporter substrate-binding protein [Klebsiella aerogenes]HCR0889134.1 ABC transporter substrate-binding protein [Klebsiella aerogenes]HDT0776603.1 ABC transporter substrate-binding protein [Klebsiella aerogenes]HDU3928948.1 ABC transporter substrate-binding protein [Klebsiella aerogenes]